MQNVPEVITLEELAQILRITETTLYQLVRSGEIPGKKVGREWRFLKANIMEWLQNNKNEKGKKMENVVYRDEWGGEYKVVGGKECIALWLPLDLKEKSQLVQKAQERNEKVSDLVAEYLKNYIK